MENLELQTQIINLGKLFVKELELEPGVDTFSRWMAHYIAEKMILTESLSSGKEKDEAEKDCFETILKLWEHRRLLPNGRRPLENFETILKVIEILDPENRDPFSHRLSELDLLEIAKSNPFYGEIKGFLEHALQIDQIAKIWIEYVLNQAAKKVNDSKTEAWLKGAVNLPDNNDVQAIRFILQDIDSAEIKESQIKKRIEELEKFAALNEFLLNRYKEDLSEHNMNNK